MSHDLQVSPQMSRRRQATGFSDVTEVDAPPAPLHHRRTVRLWILCCLSFLCCVPLISVMVGLHVHARDFSYVPSAWVPVFPGRTIQFEVVLVDADPKSRMMVMDWEIKSERSSNCSANDVQACTDVDIFFDENLLATDSSEIQVRTNNRPSNPVFRLNATAMAVGDFVANTATFRTHLALFSPSKKQSSLIYYPFDVYSAEIFLFATDSKTNELVGVEITSTRGIATGFKTAAISGSDAGIPSGMVDIQIEVHRGNLVKSFSIVVTASIWLITIILLLVMLTCVFFGFRQKSEILCLPVGTLFAFTQLRASMPGAPEGFGDILDFVGLLPCLAILSVSAAITLAAFILSDPTQKTQVFSWELLFEAFPRLDHRKHDKAIKELGTNPRDKVDASLSSVI